MYRLAECQEDLSKSPQSNEENLPTSNFLDDEIEEALKEDDFLDYFDKDYQLLDLWKSFTLLRRINDPMNICDEDFSDREYNDDYSDESIEEVPYIFRISDEQEDNDIEGDNKLIRYKVNTKEEEEEELMQQILPEEDFEEIDEELEERIAA